MKVAGSDYSNSFIILTKTGHELHGMMYYYNCHIPELNLPLMCLIDYRYIIKFFQTIIHQIRGYRLVAMSLLPVSKETIIYGKLFDILRYIIPKFISIR